MNTEAFTNALLSVFKPNEDTDPVQWMERNCKVLPGLVGHFDCAHTPWLRQPILATFDPEVRNIVNLAAVQTGKTIYTCVCVSYIVARHPAEVLLYQDKESNARDFHANTLRKVWEGCPPVRDMIPRDKQVRWSCIRLDRSTVWTLGADAESNLQRYSAKWVFCDEAWRYKPGYLAQAKARTLSFGWLGKFVTMGQGGVRGDDFSKLWESSTKEVYSWRCPHCDHLQPWLWDFVKIPAGGLTADGINADLIKNGTEMECAGCKARFADSDESRHILNQRSEYLRTNHNASSTDRGFHWNALPARSWGEMAVEWAQARLAQTNGSEMEMQLFRQKQLAIPYAFDIMDTTDDVPPGMFKLREDWEEEGGFDINTRQVIQARDTENPNHARLRFVAIDCQRDGFYALCRSWSADGRSRLFDWAYFHTIDEVDQFRKRCGVIAPFTFIDSGDQQDLVHRTAARLGYNCTRGTKKNDFPWPSRLPDGTVKVKQRPYSKPREVEPVKGHITRVYYFGNLSFKDLLWRLRRTGIHQFPVDAGDEYKMQMASERRTKTAAGVPIWKCPKSRANHLWDCETILMLPALVFGLAGELKASLGAADPDKPAEAPAEEDQGEADAD